MRQTEPEVRLTCECGRAFTASARQGRRVQRGDAKARCSACRWADMRKPLDELKTPQLRKARLPITDADRRWWLNHFTLEELCEIVAGIHGEVPETRRHRWQSLEDDLRVQELHAAVA